MYTFESAQMCTCTLGERILVYVSVPACLQKNTSLMTCMNTSVRVNVHSRIRSRQAIEKVLFMNAYEYIFMYIHETLISP